MTSNYQGARWVRTDLHLHSPGASSFVFPNGMNENQKDQIVKRYIEQLIQQNIKIAAITDYQQIHTEWFLPIQQAAREQDIFIYPGVELSFSGSAAGKEGLHLLAIFPYDSNLDDLNHVIDKMLDGNSSKPLISSDGSHRDLEPKETLHECLPEFRKKTGTLFIIAHPNDHKGLFKTFKPKEQASFLVNVLPDAVESFTTQDVQRLQSTSIGAQSLFSSIASIENSDNHSIEEIGTRQLPDGNRRTTYLKLSAFDDLRAIRMALHDEILFCRDNEPETNYTKFESLSVDGNGFLGGLSLDFSPELNVLVGGRGVGKSAILETIRYTLNLSPYSETPYREDLIKHSLGSGGKATLLITQIINQNVQRKYRIERVLGEDPRVFELVDQIERSVPLSPLEVLGEREAPLFFGQREIYEVTKSSANRRRLLDEIIGRNANEQLDLINKIKDDLQRNARAIVERRQKVTERDFLEQQLREIEHEINLYETLGIAEKLKEATSLTVDEEHLKFALGESESAVQEWQQIKINWSERWLSVQNNLAQSASQQKKLLRDASNILRQTEQGLTDLFQKGEQSLATQVLKLQTLFENWERERKPLDEEIRRIKQEIGSETLDPDKLIQLTIERERIRPQLDNLSRIEHEITDYEGERNQLLNSLREARRVAWDIRQKQAQSISEVLQGRVRVSVIYRGQHKEYTDELDSFFQGSGVARKALEKITSNVENIDGIGISEKAHLGIDTLVGTYGLSEAQSRLIVSFLEEKEMRFFDLQLLAPNDEVQVMLVMNETSLSLEKLSAGQRATAMLLILLTQQERLLLVDQPEEDLDNRFIYDDIVRILREQKGKRQLISATHNPNIPVLGHAELIVILEGQDDRSSIQEQGAIDRREVQTFVRNVMEGGKDAFLRRAQKYGIGF